MLILRILTSICIELLYFSSIYFSCSMSSETSSFNSECQDDEEIALAMQAAEIANRNEARAKFRCVFLCCLWCYVL